MLFNFFDPQGSHLSFELTPLSSNFLELYDNCRDCLEMGVGWASFDLWH